MKPVPGMLFHAPLHNCRYWFSFCLYSCDTAYSEICSAAEIIDDLIYVYRASRNCYRTNVSEIES